MAGRKKALKAAYETAKTLGVSVTSLRRWVKGGCPSSRGKQNALLFDPAEVKRWRRVNLRRQRPSYRRRRKATPTPAPADKATGAPASQPTGKASRAPKRPSATKPTREVLAQITTDLDALRAALTTRSLTDEERDRIDGLLAVAKAAKEQELVERQRTMNRKRRGELCDAAAIEAGLVALGSSLREAGETIQRQYGAEAWKLYDQAITVGFRAARRAVKDALATG